MTSVLTGVTVYAVVWTPGPTDITFQNAEMFNWTCPRCIANVMPFHDCSLSFELISPAAIAKSETVSQCESTDLPPLSSPAGLRVAHLNCRSLLSIADEVFDLFYS